MKAVVLVLACVAVAAALSVKSSPEARFMSTEEGMSSSMSAATVVSDRDYAALKHEEAEKAVQALHLPGDKPDLLTELGIDHNVAGDAEEEANDEELLALAAQTESTDSEDADAAETAEALESEIEAAEAEEDSADVLLEVAEEEKDEEEAEDEAEDESEEESEEEDAVFLEVADEEADEDEEEAEDEDEEESEDEDEAEAEDEAEEEESEDLALIAESEEKPSRYISPVLRPALPSKHNDAMPDATYDKVAETNLFPPAAHLVGAGPKPKPFSPAEIAAADAKIRAARAKKAKSKKLAAKSRKAMKAPKPAAKGRGRKARKGGRKNRKVSRKQRKNRRGSRKARRGSRKGRRGSRKGRRGGKKGRRGSRKGRKARKSRRAGKKGGASKKNKNCKKPGDPRCIITPPYLQDIRDARHHHFIKTTNDLLNEVDDGILEHMVYPKIADPNKKGCKTKKAKKF